MIIDTSHRDPIWTTWVLIFFSDFRKEFMQYIDFSEDMLYPSDENLIGLPNGFRLSDYDSDALNFTHGHLPPMFGELDEIDVTERFLSLLAVDNTNHIFERVYIHESQMGPILVWHRIRESDGLRRSMCLGCESIEFAMNMTVDKLVTMGYNYDEKQAQWYK